MIFTSPVVAFFSALSTLCPNCQISRAEDADIRTYITEFQRDCKKYNKDCEDASKTPIFWHKLDNYNIGYCWRAALEFRFASLPLPAKVIAIDPKWWKESDELSRRTLIYHELGHCELDLDHYSDYPSIMYPSILDKYHINGNWQCLVYQMFSGEKGYCFNDVLYTPPTKAALIKPAD